MNRTRLIALLAALAVLAYLGVGLSRISFNVDVLRLLPSQNHQVEGLGLFLKNFSFPKELLVTVEAPDSSRAKAVVEAVAKRLRDEPGLVKRVTSESPWENDPSNFSEFLTFLLLNQGQDRIDQLQKKLSPGSAASTLRETLDELGTSLSPQDMALMSYDPYRLTASVSGSGMFSGRKLSEFSSADGKFRVIYVEAAGLFADYKQTAIWLKTIESLCHSCNRDGGVKLGFTGEPAFVAEISTGMQTDMIRSAFATFILISLIFWLCYGRFTPLLWLLLCLQLTFLISLATAGLFLSQLTAIGAGFASVMIGLSVDYGYFVYQQSLHHSGGLEKLRRKCLQNILWTSSTTAAAFFSLNLSSLPGLAQLGNMVGIGVCLGVLVMLGLFAPLAMKFRSPIGEINRLRLDALLASERFFLMGEWLAMAMVLMLLGALLINGFPKTDFSVSSLRPRASSSQRALDQLESRLGDDPGVLNLIVQGGDERSVRSKLQVLEVKLEEEKKQGRIRDFVTPLSFWPDENRQRENIKVLAPLAKELTRLKQSLIGSGFHEEAFALTSSVFQEVALLQDKQLPFWPKNESSDWILRRVVRHGPGDFLALGVVDPTPGMENKLVDSLCGDGIYLVSWNQLGEELGRMMPGEVARVALGLLLGIILILSIGLRNIRAVLLFAMTSLLVLGCLAGAMTLFGMKWGFFNLAAIILLLGTGTDYSILLLLALKRNGGDVMHSRRELGVVIFLCCSSAAAGFGSLAWAGNMGLASLGQTCALGLVIDGIITLFLLPRAWALWSGRAKANKDDLTLQNGG